MVMEGENQLSNSHKLRVIIGYKGANGPTSLMVLLIVFSCKILNSNKHTCLITYS